MEKKQQKEPKIFVGIDWSTQHHDACAINREGKKIAERRFAHGGEGLGELCSWLTTFGVGSEEIAIGIEVPRGPVVEALLERGFRTFSLNPKQMDRFRDRFTVAGAKDDRFDALVIGDSLRTDSVCFRELRVEDPLVVELREWSRVHDELQDDRVRLRNQMREQLWRYFPQFLEVSDDFASDWMLELWTLAPTPALAGRVEGKAVEKILRQYRVRSTTSDKVLAKLREPELRVAAGVVNAAQGRLILAVERMRLLNRQLKSARKKLDEICERMSEGQKDEQRDVEILKSLPGVGRIVLATLLAEANEPLRARDYHALRALSGAAPVTKNSGKRRAERSKVEMRRACDVRLRNAVYHWARTAMQHDELSRAKYAALRARGKSHGRALRTVADRLLNVACAMLHAGTTFNASHSQRSRVAEVSQPHVPNPSSLETSTTSEPTGGFGGCSPPS